MSDVEPGAHRRIWEIGLAAIKEELGAEPVESLGDVLRLGERVLATAGLDVGARFDAMAGDTYARIVPRTSRRASSRRAKVLAPRVRTTSSVVCGPSSTAADSRQ